MSAPDLKRRCCHARRQAAYEARQRAGVGLYLVPLGPAEIDALVDLGWLREGAEIDRGRVGDAVAQALREMARWKKSLTHQVRSGF